MQIEVLIDASDQAAARSLATLKKAEMGIDESGLYRDERVQVTVLLALVQQLEAVRYAILASIAEEHIPA